ncbi:hypothetical protein D9M71_682510 [compost metagenome]
MPSISLILYFKVSLWARDMPSGTWAKCLSSTYSRTSSYSRSRSSIKCSLVGPTRIRPPPGLSRRLASCQSSGLKTLARNWQLASGKGTRAMLATSQVTLGLRLQARLTASREISSA